MGSVHHPTTHPSVIQDLLGIQESLLSRNVIKMQDMDEYESLSFNEKQMQFKDTIFAIKTIVSEKLYSGSFKSVEEYFRLTWGVSRAQVYRLMDCCHVLKDLIGSDDDDASLSSGRNGSHEQTHANESVKKRKRGDTVATLNNTQPPSVIMVRFSAIPFKERMCRALKSIADGDKYVARYVWSKALSIAPKPELVCANSISAAWVQTPLTLKRSFMNKSVIVKVENGHEYPLGDIGLRQDDLNRLKGRVPVGTDSKVTEMAHPPHTLDRPVPSLSTTVSVRSKNREPFPDAELSVPSFRRQKRRLSKGHVPSLSNASLVSRIGEIEDAPDSPLSEHSVSVSPSSQVPPDERHLVAPSATHSPCHNQVQNITPTVQDHQSAIASLGVNDFLDAQKQLHDQLNDSTPGSESSSISSSFLLNRIFQDSKRACGLAHQDEDNQGTLRSGSTSTSVTPTSFGIQRRQKSIAFRYSPDLSKNLRDDSLVPETTFLDKHKPAFSDDLASSPTPAPCGRNNRLVLSMDSQSSSISSGKNGATMTRRIVQESIHEVASPRGETYRHRRVRTTTQESIEFELGSGINWFTQHQQRLAEQHHEERGVDQDSTKNEYHGAPLSFDICAEQVGMNLFPDISEILKGNDHMRHTDCGISSSSSIITFPTHPVSGILDTFASPTESGHNSLRSVFDPETHANVHTPKKNRFLEAIFEAPFASNSPSPFSSDRRIGHQQNCEILAQQSSSVLGSTLKPSGVPFIFSSPMKHQNHHHRVSQASVRNTRYISSSNIQNLQVSVSNSKDVSDFNLSIESLTTSPVSPSLAAMTTINKDSLQLTDMIPSHGIDSLIESSPCAHVGLRNVGAGSGIHQYHHHSNTSILLSSPGIPDPRETAASYEMMLEPARKGSLPVSLDMIEFNQQQTPVPQARRHHRRSHSEIHMRSFHHHDDLDKGENEDLISFWQLIDKLSNSGYQLDAFFPQPIPEAGWHPILGHENNGDVHDQMNLRWSQNSGSKFPNL